MMDILLFNYLFLLLAQYASTQLAVDYKTSTPRKAQDPVSKLFDELGLLVLDADEAFSRHTAPKVENENEMKTRMYGRPRSEYFNRIRDNYKTIQQRVGSFNINDAFSISSKLFGVNVKNDGQRSLVDVAIPALPVHINLRSENPLLKKQLDSSSSAEGYSIIHPQGSSFTGKIQVGDAEMKIHSTVTVSPEVLSEPNQGDFLPGHLTAFGSPDEPVKSRKERGAQPLRRANDGDVSLFYKNYQESLSNTDTGSEDLKALNTEVVLDDVSHSKSAMESLTKKALKEAQVALDSDLAPSEIIDKLDSLAKLVLARRRKSASEETADSSPSDAGLDEARLEAAKRNETQATSRKETILSAYTNNGVPVKLRIGPEVGDPYRFLHRLLSLNEVTLRVQVKPKGGKESEDPPLPANALYVDLLDPSQRKAFLQVLRKLKTGLE